MVVLTIWLGAATERNLEKLPSMEKVLLWKSQIKRSRLRLLRKTMLSKIHNATCTGVFF